MATIKSEARIQQECVIGFHNKYKDLRGCLFAVPNGGARSITEGNLLKKTGVVPGVSDLILLYNKRAWLFELKNALGHQSVYQKKWQKLMESQGFRYMIYRDSNSFMNIIDKIINNEIKM